MDDDDAHYWEWHRHKRLELKLYLSAMCTMADEHARKAVEHAEYALKYRDAAAKLHNMAADSAKRLAILEDDVDW